MEEYNQKNLYDKYNQLIQTYESLGYNGEITNLQNKIHNKINNETHPSQYEQLIKSIDKYIKKNNSLILLIKTQESNNIKTIINNIYSINSIYIKLQLDTILEEFDRIKDETIDNLYDLVNQILKFNESENKVQKGGGNLYLNKYIKYKIKYYTLFGNKLLKK